MKTVSWIGEFDGTYAFNRYNRLLSTALERRGWQVACDSHFIDGQLTDYLVSCTYPPRVPAIRHPKNTIISTWEYTGLHGTPQTFLNVFEQYDLVWAMCQQAAAAFTQAGAGNVCAGRVGVEPDEFCATGDRFPVETLVGFDNSQCLLCWVGGTDPRHGFDVAIEVISRLPANYVLIAKQGTHYPRYPVEHDRIILLREDLPSLAPVYRACNLLINTAHGVGPGLPVIEALCSGLPVVSTDLPAVREFGAVAPEADPYVRLVPTQLERFNHPVHNDCTPYWWTLSSIDEFVETILRFSDTPHLPAAQASQIADAWSWDRAAELLEQSLLSLPLL